MLPESCVSSARTFSRAWNLVTAPEAMHCVQSRFSGAPARRPTLPRVVLVAVFCSLAEFRHLALHADFSVLFGLWLVFRFLTVSKTSTSQDTPGDLRLELPDLRVALRQRPLSYTLNSVGKCVSHALYSGARPTNDCARPQHRSRAQTAPPALHADFSVLFGL